MAELKVTKAFDADNHYYEALDAFTRHIEPQYAKRAMQWAEVNGKQTLLVGEDQPLHPQPARSTRSAGAGRPRRVLPREQPQGAATQDLFGELEPDRPRLPRSRRPHRASWTARHRAALFFLRRSGVGMEQALIDDLPAALAAFRAFNGWMDDDWGFAYQERIFAAPYITLSTPTTRWPS